MIEVVAALSGEDNSLLRTEREQIAEFFKYVPEVTDAHKILQQKNSSYVDRPTQKLKVQPQKAVD